MTELVTAVIPTYNYARFVARAIDSVLAQTYRHIECIVVDDGSTDDTAEILSRYGDRLVAIRQPNRGLSAARNAGLQAARGAYVAFLDADDWWHPEKASRQVAALQQRPDVGCVGCGRRHVALDGQTLEEFPGQPGARDRRALLRGVALRTFWVGGSGSGAMIRRSVVERVGGFDEGLKAAEDWDMWLRLAATTQIDNVPDILTCITRHGSGSFRNVRRMEEAQWAVYRKLQSAPDGPLTARDLRRVRSLIYADAAWECQWTGDSLDAMRYYLRSIATWPFAGGRWTAALRLAARAAVRVTGTKGSHVACARGN
jgi:glycosyltransferase involved in cell wall biosynthesis